jgi:predicted small secreted protein
VRRTGMNRTALARAGLAAASLLLAGCAAVSSAGSGGSGLSGGSGGSGGSPSSPGGASTGGTMKGTALTVTIEAQPGAPAKTWTLSCDPPTGSHPQAAAACAQLAAYSAKQGDPFAETPKGVMCSMIYGGDQKATVTGTYQGSHVSTRFARTDGCEVARWERVSALLVETGGVPNAAP